MISLGAIHILHNGLEGGRGLLKYYIPLRGGGGQSNQKLHNNYRPLKNDKNHEISQNFTKFAKLGSQFFPAQLVQKLEIYCAI